MTPHSHSNSPPAQPLSSECWVFVECPHGKILRESLEALTVGLMFQEKYQAPATILWAGLYPEEAQIAYLSSLGVKKIWVLDASENDTDPETSLLSGLQSLCLETSPQQIFFGPSPLSLRLAPRLAARLETGYIANTTYLRKVGKTLSLTRPIMQGKLSEILGFASPGPGLVSLYPRAFGLPAPLADTSDKAMLETCPLEPQQQNYKGWIVVESTEEASRDLDIEDGEIIVAGGKGIGSEKNFMLLENLAEALGGTVGASRIAVDLGWAPKERLVGQTGKKVAPELYIACGISGAPQHRIGMKDSRYILAINTDPNAPIFQVATWGILGDACEVVTEMADLVKAQQGQDKKIL